MDKKIRIENKKIADILRGEIEYKEICLRTEENGINEMKFYSQKDLSQEDLWGRKTDDIGYYEEWYKDFTQEELDSITELSICYTNVGDIKELEKLKNLKKLSIISGNSNLYAKIENGEIDEESPYYREKNNIDDFKMLGKLKNIEELRIESEENLSKLDVTNMKNLKKLELINNINLKEVIGLKEVENLEKILMSRNGTGNLELKEFDIMSAVENKRLKEVILDVDMFPNLIKEFPQLVEKIEEYEKNNEKVYTWIENKSTYEHWENKFSTRNLKEMDIRVEEILQNIIKPEYTEIEKTLAIYNYITDNVAYDYKMLEFDQEMQKYEKYFLFLEGSSNRSSYSIINKRILGKQSSFNAIMKGKAVCQGYAQMMHYMLTKENIESREIGCIANQITEEQELEDKEIDHSVIRVKTDDNWYYYDPTWDAGKTTYEYAYKTKDEFYKKYTLSAQEEKIQSVKQKKYNDKELENKINKIYSDKNDKIIKKQNEKKDTVYTSLFKGLKGLYNKFCIRKEELENVKEELFDREEIIRENSYEKDKDINRGVEDKEARGFDEREQY